MAPTPNGSNMAPTANETAAYLALAKRVALDAGAMITEALKSSQIGYDRKSATDPVTETDRAVESYIFSEVRKAYPDHSFIGEESAPDEKLTDAPTWICDPIDVRLRIRHILGHSSDLSHCRLRTSFPS
jgi:3'-phosphoadenosine 5'-phosphosulfate (PAPS) 3'-phosphatase